MSNQNDIQKRLNKAKGNATIFAAPTLSMSVTAIFMAFATSVSSPGTILAAALGGFILRPVDC